MKTFENFQELLSKDENLANTIVAFHIGRGGRFNNEGHLFYIGVDKIEKFTDDLFVNFENAEKFKNRFGFVSTGDKNQRCILDLITDKDFDELEEKFGITEKMLGEEMYYDGGGNPTGLTASDVDSGIGKINIDNGYDTTYTCFLKDIDESEFDAIIINENNCYIPFEIEEEEEEIN
jgi:hypothetical protein